jgi:hypothetical protein
MHPEARKTAITVIALSVFAICLVVALNMDRDDGEGGKCGTCENPPTIAFHLYQEDIHQTDVETYNASFILEGYNFVLDLPVSEVDLPGFLEEDDGSGGPHFQYVDLDEDDQVTNGDELRFINLTADHIGRGFNRYTAIGMYKDDPDQYLVNCRFLNDKILSNGVMVTYLQCTMREDSMEPPMEDIDFGFVDKNGVVVVDAFATWVDDDGDGRASNGDMVRVEFMPYLYSRFTIQLIVDGHLIGYGSINGSPDTT